MGEMRMIGDKELVEQYRAAYKDAVDDDYAFAEWLIDTREYYGKPGGLSGSELEGAFDEARRLYKRVRKEEIDARAAAGA